MKKSIKWLAVLASTLAVGAFTFTACDGCNDDPPGPGPVGTDNEITVTFINGNSTFETVKGKAGDAITPLTAPTKEGYSFDGWETSNGEEFVPTTIPDADMAVYARMSANNYTVEFNSNGSTSANITYNATYDKDIIVPQAALNFSKPGYDLGGWAKTATADAADYNIGAKLTNLTSVKDGKVTLYAYYQPKASIIMNDFTVIENTDGEKIIVEYTGTNSSITLPTGCTKIADYAFANNTTLRSVTVPATYTEIGFGAFEGCKSLERLEVPFIGGGDEDNAYLAYIFGAPTYTDNNFAYSMSQHDDMLTMDEKTLVGIFYIPQSLRTVVLNAKVDEIKEGAFYYAYGLERLVVYTYETTDGNYEYPIKKVGKSAFEGCHRLGEDSVLNIPYRMDWLSGVETFEEKSFKGYVSENSYYTSRLMDVGTLSSAKVIGDEAFAYNSRINYLYFGDKLESIGNSAFKSVNFLQIVDIPDSCVSIGEEAFYSSGFLASVALGKGIKEIGAKAFAVCPQLTEVFFYGEVPANIPNNVFYGYDEENSKQLDDVNPGLVFYFEDEAKQTAGESKLHLQYTSAQFGVAGYFGGPFYSIDTDYDYILYFTEGHLAVIYDPYFRSGIGFIMMAGKYEKVDTWYDAEMYNVQFLGDIEYTVKIDYYISSSPTHYYKYKIGSFSLEELREDQTSVKIGSKSDEWYIEENAYSQMALWHNGEFVDLKDGNSFAGGGVSAFYADGTIREISYYQANEFFEHTLVYSFIYTPNPDKEDTRFEHFGTLTLLDKEHADYNYDTYLSTDGNTTVTVNGYTNELAIVIGENVIEGEYEIVSEAKEESLVYKLVKNDKEYTVTLSAFKKNVTTTGTSTFDIYSLCKVEAGDDTYMLYNSNFFTVSDNYLLDVIGDPTIEKYFLIQYAQIIGENNFSYSGHAEYTDADGNVEYIPFDYNQIGYTFHTASGDVRGILKNNESGFAIGSGSNEKIFRPYVEREKGSHQKNGDVTIILSGYGTATYIDSNNPTGIKGSYGMISSTALSYVYVSETEYYGLYEYAFISGNFTYFFIPNFYDAADGSLMAGQMLVPDKTRGQIYRVFDPVSNYCTAEFISYGYGMGVMYILKYPDSMNVANIEDYDNAAGVTPVRYEKIGERDGKDVYSIVGYYSMGFFTFTIKDDVPIYGKNPQNMASHPGYELVVDDEYTNRWWMEIANLFVSGKIYPPDEVYELMYCKEEAGEYTASGYTLKLDGYGNAILKADGGEEIKAEYASAYDANLNGYYTFTIAVDENTIYRGQLNVSTGNIKVIINGVQVEFVKVVESEANTEN